MRKFCGSLAILSMLLGVPSQGEALELTEKLNLEANLTWVHQWLEKRRGDFKDVDRGSIVLDGRVNFKPTEVDEFSLRASVARGNGLKKVNPFFITPNADDLREDLHNVNRSSRDHLQELWYARTFHLPGNYTLKGTVGILDSTAFLDDNRFANNELTQFMNEVFVNNPLAILVNYDYGVALEIGKGPFLWSMLAKRSKTECETDNPLVKNKFHAKKFNYYATQVGYKWDTELGEGNLRVFAFTTNKRFPDWEEEKREARKGWGVSFDQDIVKDRLGVFARIGFQDDKAQVCHKSMYSFGISTKFCLAGLREINLGLGYAFLRAPDKHPQLKNTRALEAYMAIPIYEMEKKFSSVLTFDWQYLRDKLKESEELPAERVGHVWGMRLNLSF